MGIKVIVFTIIVRYIAVATRRLAFDMFFSCRRGPYMNLRSDQHGGLGHDNYGREVSVLDGVPKPHREHAPIECASGAMGAAIR